MSNSLEISVEELASAGYQWQVKEQINCNYTDSRLHTNTRNGELLVGGASTIAYEITPIDPGDYTFVIVYSRPWEDWNVPDKVIEIKGFTL